MVGLEWLVYYSIIGGYWMTGGYPYFEKPSCEQLLIILKHLREQSTKLINHSKLLLYENHH